MLVSGEERQRVPLPECVADGLADGIPGWMPRPLDVVMMVSPQRRGARGPRLAGVPEAWDDGEGNAGGSRRRIRRFNAADAPTTIGARD